MKARQIMLVSLFLASCVHHPRGHHDEHMTPHPDLPAPVVPGSDEGGLELVCGLPNHEWALDEARLYETWSATEAGQSSENENLLHLATTRCRHERDESACLCRAKLHLHEVCYRASVSVPRFWLEHCASGTADACIALHDFLGGTRTCIDRRDGPTEFRQAGVQSPVLDNKACGFAIFGIDACATNRACIAALPRSSDESCHYSMEEWTDAMVDWLCQVSGNMRACARTGQFVYPARQCVEADLESHRADLAEGLREQCVLGNEDACWEALDVLLLPRCHDEEQEPRSAIDFYEFTVSVAEALQVPVDQLFAEVQQVIESARVQQGLMGVWVERVPSLCQQFRATSHCSVAGVIVGLADAAAAEHFLWWSPMLRVLTSSPEQQQLTGAPIDCTREGLASLRLPQECRQLIEDHW